MNPRLRRLLADAAALRTEFAGHPQISVEALGYEPAEAYRVTFKLRGVTLGPDGQPIVTELHEVVIQLPASYPRDKPVFTTVTQVFHPNFGTRAGDEICIGDYWSPSQGLADIVVMIGEMIQFQRYNTKSPLNAVAARWAAENESIFPIGRVELFQSEPEIRLSDPSTVKGEMPLIRVETDAIPAAAEDS